MGGIWKFGHPLCSLNLFLISDGSLLHVLQTHLFLLDTVDHVHDLRVSGLCDAAAKLVGLMQPAS